MRSEVELESLGLRPRHLIVLMMLGENRGSAGRQELAALLWLDRTNLVGLLNQLEAEELVLRRRAAEDRRRHIVELTAAGEERLVAAEKAIGAGEDEVLGALDDRQREQLFEPLQQAAAGGGAPSAGAPAAREDPPRAGWSHRAL
jgi:DNA-binding MarR family transcriptional regulator